jgi:pimeloyl-ACP methyl ester carboxylesterase
MQRIPVDDGELEVATNGSGEPVLLIHGSGMGVAFALMADEPALRDYRVIRYHRRGFVGSSRHTGPFPIAKQAADARGVLRALGVERAHVVGHSYGGVTALELALRDPEAVQTLALLEPALLEVPSGAGLFEAMAPAVAAYQAGDRARAMETFLKLVVGEEPLPRIAANFPEGFAQAVADADTFFEVEVPALQQWSFTQEHAKRIRQPVLAVVGAESAAVWKGWDEIQERLRAWFPQAEAFALPRATHALQMVEPRGMAERLAQFFTRHPL